MSIVDVINKLSRRFNSFRVIDIPDPQKLVFCLGVHVYAWHAVTQGMLELDGEKYGCSAHSDWVQGIILGKVRNDSGELVDA